MFRSHMLRGTQNWLNVFDFSNINGKISKWRILHYIKQDIKPNLTLGKVYKEADNFFVYCGLGLIYMELLIEAEGLFITLNLLKIMPFPMHCRAGKGTMCRRSSMIGKINILK